MDINDSIFKDEERIAFMLRSLYRMYGFHQYKMSKFEEYVLYADNRDFLVSDDIITFTDKTGRLMALKPDVTLSIVKSTKDIPGVVDRVYYNENVYRTPRGSHTYKEMMQVGIECIGDIDDYNIFEAVLLAVKSLDIISEDNRLTISHLGIITSLFDDMGLKGEERKQALKLIAGKNMHELKELLEKNSLEAAETDSAVTPRRSISSFIRALKQNGSPEEVLEVLKEERCSPRAIAELTNLIDMLREAGAAGRVVIDFSTVSDMKYYNSIVFNGYISGVPESVLRGGQYGKLLRKLGRHSRAIGFAVYMDFLEMYFKNDSMTDVDAVIKYDNSTDKTKLFKAARSLMAKGITCTVQKEIPAKLKNGTIYIIDGAGSLKVLSGKEADNA